MSRGENLYRSQPTILVGDQIACRSAKGGYEVRSPRLEPRYRTFRIPKKGKGYRTIRAPAGWLKEEQRNILRWLSGMGIIPGRHTHGFVHGRSVLTNAAPHVGRRVVVKMDLVNFFDMVGKNGVSEALCEADLSVEDSRHIIRLCMTRGSLPQGAPTSPLLANLAAMSMDANLAAYVEAMCHPVAASYTRYADDLTFSSNSMRLSRSVNRLGRIILDHGFEVNKYKVRVMRLNKLQIVTGVVVNEKANVPRKRRRAIRAEVHNVKMALLDGKQVDDKKMERLYGLAGYTSMLSEHHGARIKREVDEINRMRSEGLTLREA